MSYCVGHSPLDYISNQKVADKKPSFPPVFRMLGEYLPELRAKNERVLCPSPEMVQEVRKWINRRNDLSRGKSAGILFV